MVFCLGFAFPIIFGIGQILLLGFLILLTIDVIYLLMISHHLEVKRVIDEKLSNGDENTVQLLLKGDFALKVSLNVIDELPYQLSHSVSEFSLHPPNKSFTESISYVLIPKERGEYAFGNVRIGYRSVIGLIERFKTIEIPQIVKVYPSIVQYRRFSLLSMANRLDEAGIKHMRKIGGASEFDQIKEYRRGDDYKRINWKATARKNSLMVNKYEDEKAQQVYLVLDKGRMMHMPFEGLSLFDYAVNSALVLAGIAQSKRDKPGLITFSDIIGSWLPPSQKSSQIGLINETLYKQETRLKEPNYERLLLNVRKQIKNRSLLILFTNFESRISMKRQLKYLQALAKNHLLLCVIFENTELEKLAETNAKTMAGYYDQAIAENLILEKQMIIKELGRHGIQAISTKPENLSVNTINKYLELKARGMI